VGGGPADIRAAQGISRRSRRQFRPDNNPTHVHPRKQHRAERGLPLRSAPDRNQLRPHWPPSHDQKRPWLADRAHIVESWKAGSPVWPKAAMLAADLRGGRTHNSILSSSPPPSPSQFSLPFLGLLEALPAEDFPSPWINAAAFAEDRRRSADYKRFVHEGIYADGAGFLAACESYEMLPAQRIQIPDSSGCVSCRCMSRKHC
jgi:hypothetical protein